MHSSSRSQAVQVFPDGVTEVPALTKLLVVGGSGAVGVRRCLAGFLPVDMADRLLGGERRPLVLDGETRPFGETRVCTREPGGESLSCEARVDDGEARP